MKINFQLLRKNAVTPKYQSNGAAGFDFAATIDQKVEIPPQQIAKIPTGIAVEIPRGYEIQIRPRSGLAFNFQVAPVNSPGTIDSDFRGEIIIGLENRGAKTFIVEPGMRIAQGILAKYEIAEFSEKKNLSETARSANGFGSTGVK